MTIHDYDAARAAEIDAVRAGLRRCIDWWRSGVDPSNLRTAILELAKRAHRVGNVDAAEQADRLAALVERNIPEVAPASTGQTNRVPLPERTDP